MSEPILHLEEIANYIADLLKKVRTIEKELKLLKRTDELSIGEPPEDVGGSFGGGTSAEFLTPIVRVTTITSENLFRGLRQRPDDVAGWIDDTDFVNELELCSPANVALPVVDDLLGVRFTGNYQRFTAGFTLTLPRYGAFQSTGNERARLTLNRVGGNLLDAVLIDNAGSVIRSIVVARPPDLQTDFYDGQTQDGVTFTKVDNTERTAVDGVNPDETHKISPSYINSISILQVERMDRGTGFTESDLPVIWQDVTPGRQWATLAATP